MKRVQLMMNLYTITIDKFASYLEVFHEIELRTKRSI